MNNSKLTILIIDPSEIIRMGLLTILNEETTPFLIKHSDGDGDLAVITHKIEPQIVLISPNIYTDHIKLFQTLKEKNGMLIVGIIYSFYHPNSLQNFDGLIYLNERQETILSTINKLISASNSTQTSSNNDTLSERETEILKLIVSGFSTKKIAGSLFISTHTVNAHRKNIMRKLDIKTISGLTIYAVLNNIIDLKEA